MRFSGEAFLLEQSVLVILTVAFTLAVLSTQYEPASTSSGGILGWVGLAIRFAICALVVRMLCHSEEIVIDPIARRVTQ